MGNHKEPVSNQLPRVVSVRLSVGLHIVEGPADCQTLFDLLDLLVYSTTNYNYSDGSPPDRGVMPELAWL